MGKTLLLFKSLLMSVCTLTLTTQAQSLSDVTNINVDECYIYDSFLSADWGNESMAPGNGSTANGLKVGLQEPARSTRGQRWQILVELNLNI